MLNQLVQNPIISQPIPGAMIAAPESNHNAPQSPEPVIAEFADYQNTSPPDQQVNLSVDNRQVNDSPVIPNNNQLPVLSWEETLKEFDKSLTDLWFLGQTHLKEKSTHRNKMDGKAVTVLAQILGIRHTYFTSAPFEDQNELMEELKKKCKKNKLKNGNSRSSEFHYLSRLYRGSDRKQASSDATILKRAFVKGYTEQTFPDWVKEKGGLDNIRKKISAKEKEEAKAAAEAKKKAEAEAKAASEAEAKSKSWVRQTEIAGNYTVNDLLKIVPDARLICIKLSGDNKSGRRLDLFVNKVYMQGDVHLFNSDSEQEAKFMGSDLFSHIDSEGQVIPNKTKDDETAEGVGK